jgi:hypothetical protein
VVAVLGVSLLIVFGGCPKPQASPRSALMVYATDQSQLQALGDYLQQHDISVTYCNLASLPANFKRCGVIVLGPDTDDATQEQADALEASGKPMLGIGEGGYAVFGLLGLSIGYPNGSHSTDGTSLRVEIPGSPFFAIPNSFSVTPVPSSIPTFLITSPGGSVSTAAPFPRTAA